MPRKTKPRAIDARTRELFAEKLASSGLTFEDAELLGLETIEAGEVQSLNSAWPNKPAIKINYYCAFGDPLADIPSAPPFFRLRFLGEGTSFKDMAGKELRYVQLQDTAPCAYLPRSFEWADIMPDVQTSLIITEGELKAAKACKEGFPTIGLGGVWNFRSNKYGISFVKELEQFEWLRRNVYVVFDSDLASNQNVLAALEELCYELQQRGAFVHVVWLPEVLGSGEKVGLDDFLLFHGDKCKEEFVEVLRQAEHIGLVKALFDLNQRFVYVANPGLIIDQQTQAKHKPGALKEHLAAPTTVSVKELTADGKIRYKRASAGAEWLRWPLRSSVSKISYLPGKDRFVNSGALTFYNEWAGWGVEPRKGDVTPFLQLLNHLFTGSDKGAMEWLIKWLAYPIQYPGAKLFTSVVVWGRRHGTGKSLVGHTMSKIYGDNFTMIKQKDLHGSFNEWAQNKQFVLGDDVTGSDSRIDADILKTLITQEIIRVNPKYVPSYEVPDCINYFFTSNQPDAFFLEDDDRRFFIHEVKVEPLSETWYMDYALWLDSGGASYVFDYLSTLDLADFNPAGRAMKTLAKERMQADVLSDLGAWVRKMLQDPDSLLKIGEIPLKKDLYTNHELLQLYDPMGKSRTTANGLGRELRRAGATQALDGRPIRTKAGQDRYYILRNHDKWSKASHGDFASHVDDNGKAHKSSGAKY